MSQESQDNNDVARAQLINQSNQIYMQLVTFLQELPIDERIKQFSIMNLDQGMMWLGQGIRALKIEKPVPNETAEAPAEVTPPDAA